jgi:hypothetical protein
MLRVRMSSGKQIGWLMIIGFCALGYFVYLNNTKLAELSSMVTELSSTAADEYSENLQRQTTCVGPQTKKKIIAQMEKESLLRDTVIDPSDETINEAYRWSQQCYLSHNLKNILSDNNEYNSQEYKRPWHYVTSVTSRNQNTSTANFTNRFHLTEVDADFVKYPANVLYQIGGTKTSRDKLLAKDAEIRKATKDCQTGPLEDLKRERALLQKQAWLKGLTTILGEDTKSENLISTYPRAAPGQDMSIPSRKRHQDVVKGLTGKDWPIKTSNGKKYWRLFTFKGNVANMKAFLEGKPGTSSDFDVQPMTTGGVPEKLSALAKTFNTAEVGSGDLDGQLGEFLERTVNWSYPSGDNDNTKDVHINYFYLGDLLELMAHRAFSDQGFTTSGGTQLTGGSFGTAEKMKIITGPVKLRDFMDPDNTINASLSDLPISAEVFTDFWYRNVILTERPVYSFMEFVRDLGDQVINKAFGEGCAGDTNNSLTGQTRLKTGFLSLPQHSTGQDPLLHLKGSPYDPKTGDLISDQIKVIYDPDALESTPSDQTYNYVVLWLENQEAM